MDSKRLRELDVEMTIVGGDMDLSGTIHYPNNKQQCDADDLHVRYIVWLNRKER